MSEYKIPQAEIGEKLSGYWRTGIGLQQVDGLEPSKYLIETANATIEGTLSLSDAKVRIEKYYQLKKGKALKPGTEEADKVSLRIVALLAEKTFVLSPPILSSIHEALFKNIYSFAGTFRDYNIRKDEWVLNGDTVQYASHTDIPKTLAYDFLVEKTFDYSDLNNKEAVVHIARFVSDIWQIHPFGEGNTRTIAVFTVKYLSAFGFDIANEPFEKDSLYFRNALVRANYENFPKGVRRTFEPLDKFFDNLLFNAGNQLKNRDLHIDNMDRRHDVDPY